jgi:hypothetical protein
MLIRQRKNSEFPLHSCSQRHAGAVLRNPTMAVHHPKAQPKKVWRENAGNCCVLLSLWALQRNFTYLCLKPLPLQMKETEIRVVLEIPQPSGHIAWRSGEKLCPASVTFHLHSALQVPQLRDILSVSAVTHSYLIPHGHYSWKIGGRVTPSYYPVLWCTQPGRVWDPASGKACTQ